MKNSKLKSLLKSMNAKKNDSIEKLSTDEIKIIKGGKAGNDGLESADAWCLINLCGKNT